MENFDFLNSFLFPYINWIIFLILAYLMLRKPLINALAAKRHNYAELVEKANLARAEAEKRNAELKQRLARLDQEVAAIKATAHQQADEEARAMVSSAEQLAEHLKREAKRIADAEVSAAKIALQKEILELVKVQAAEHIQKNLDSATHHRVIQDGLAHINPSQARSS